MSKSDVSRLKRYLRPLSMGVLFGAIICMCLLAVMALVMSIGDIPQGLVFMLASIAFWLGGLAGGFFCACLSKERGLLLGLCCGLILSAICLLASLTMGGPNWGGAAIARFVAMLFACALGGVLGVNRRKKVR